MPQQFSRGGVIYQDNGDGTATVIGYESTPLVPPDPSKAFAVPQAQADARRTQAQADIATAQAPYAGSVAAADAGKAQASAATTGLKPGFMWVDPNNPAAGQIKIPTAPTPTDPANRERSAQIRAALSAIQQARKQAGERLAVGSASQFFSGTPVLNQNRLNIEATLRNAEAGIIQDMVKSLAESNQGGVSGMANTNPEARRMGAAIADLSPDQDMPSLLMQLDRAEEYYLRQAALAEGVDGPNEDIMKRYLPAERLREMAARPPEGDMALSADTKAVEIPQWYQDAVNRYVADKGKDLDPSQYAAFRMGLDEKAGIPSNLQYYVEGGQRLKADLERGARVGPMDSTRSVITSPGEQRMTEFAQTPFGAGTVAAFNSAAAGLPGALTGRNEQIEAVRQNQPVASFVGDLAGGVAGTMMMGGALGAAGARGLAANPMVQNAAFGAVSGATQSEDPLMGAATGFVSSIGGDLAGRALGRSLPAAFAPGSMRAARETVPSDGDLANQADRLYRAAAANGEMIQPAQTNRFIDDTETFLRDNGYMTQQGELLGTGPVQEATRLLQSFRDQPIGPLQARTIRERIAEGRMAMREGAPDNQARMFSGQLTNQFDQFAEAQNALPGIAAAREVAQRRIMGRELQRARELGEARGEINYSQGGGDLGIRRAFGALDTGEIRGSRMYPPAVSEAIQNVSRGTPIRNAMQILGRAAPVTGVGASAPIGLGTLAGLGTMDPATGLMTAGAVGATGLFGRSVANRMTRADAEMAELVARGGPAFQNLLQQVVEEAAIRGGRVGAGALSSTTLIPLRD